MSSEFPEGFVGVEGPEGITDVGTGARELGILSCSGIGDILGLELT